ncbi:MAG: ABC transporter substrate-binding protein [Pseudomonadota bacterium]
MRRESFVRWCNVAVIFLLSFAVAFILGGECAYSKEVRGITNDTVTIGIQASMTGVAAEQFADWVDGIRSYYRNINDQGGGIHGRKIKFILEDTRYSMPLSAATFRKLIYKDKVFTLFGPDGTGQVKMLERQIQKLRVPCIGISMAKTVVQPTQRYIFIAATPYEDQINVMFDYLMNVLKLKEPRIAVVYLDVEYGKFCFRAAEERAKLYGLKIVDVETLSLMNLDPTSQVLNLKKSNADYVIIPLAGEFAVSVIKTAHKFGYNGTFLGNHYTCEDDVLRSLPFPVENYMGVHSFNSWHHESPGMDNLRNLVLKDNPRSSPHRSRATIQGWISSLLWAEGLRRAGKDLTIEAFVDALESIKKLDTEGICGPVALGPDDHIAADYCRIYKAVPDKKIMAPLTDWMVPVTNR